MKGKDADVPTEEKFEFGSLGSSMNFLKDKYKSKPADGAVPAASKPPVPAPPAVVSNKP